MDKVLDFSKKIILEIVNKDIAIDCTCGRGNDTLFLAKNFQKVYAFDIQDEAISDTINLLTKENINNTKVIKDSHVNILNYVSEKIDCAMYNLGYLPKGNKDIHTIPFTTLESIKMTMNLLNKDGIISIVFYPGFPSGKEETDLVLEYLRQVNQKEFDVLMYDYINQINNPPFLVLIKRI